MLDTLNYKHVFKGEWHQQEESTSRVRNRKTSRYMYNIHDNLCFKTTDTKTTEDTDWV